MNGNRRTEDERAQVRERRLRRRARSVWGRRALNLFLLWHIAAVTLWLLPSDWRIVQTLVPEGGPVRAYLIATGFQQSWQMFSPNPDNTDTTLQAAITYRNGAQRIWAFPRMKDMGYEERYRRERVRKLVEVGKYEPSLWPALARYAARACNDRPQNGPPVLVTLTRILREIPPPGQTAPPARAETFYTGNVVPEALQ